MTRIRTKFRAGQLVWVGGFDDMPVTLLDILEERVDPRDEHRQVCWAAVTLLGDVVEVIEDYWQSGAFSTVYRYQAPDWDAALQAQRELLEVAMAGEVA